MRRALLVLVAGLFVGIVIYVALLGINNHAVSIAESEHDTLHVLAARSKVPSDTAASWNKPRIDERTLELLVLVLSTANGLDRRRAVRDTWKRYESSVLTQTADSFNSLRDCDESCSVHFARVRLCRARAYVTRPDDWDEIRNGMYSLAQSRVNDVFFVFFYIIFNLCTTNVVTSLAIEVGGGGGGGVDSWKLVVTIRCAVFRILA